MDENALATELLPHALRVARCMTRDPEADSAAGIAVLRAIRTYDAKRGDLTKWVARWVRTVLWNGWRKDVVRKHTRGHKSEEFWDEVAETPPLDESEIEVAYSDFKLLVEYYMERWPLDVVARRYQTTVYGARKMLAAAAARFIKEAQNGDATA